MTPASLTSMPFTPTEVRSTICVAASVGSARTVRASVRPSISGMSWSRSTSW